MKKALYSILIILVLLFSVSGCGFKEEDEVITDAITFKEEYEELNGEENYRNITIDETNPFIYSTGKEIVERIENGETFYVYFGSSYCPWCRSVIEKFIEVANKNNIDKVYYVDIWEGDHKEILRDVYELDDNGKPKLVSEGDESYTKLLEYFDSLLNDYTLTNSKGKKVKVGEKRIFAPNFVYVEKGKAKKLVEGISSEQSDSRESLTEEILKDEEEIFTEFFSK